MPTDNVIPISRRRRHPEAIPAPDAGQRRFRWFVAGLAVVWAGALAAAVAFTPLPSIWPLLALAVLVVAAEHRFILFGDETSMSSSIVVILCAVAYWRNDAFLVGPMLVAACGGLLVQHFRSRSLSLIAANGSIFSLSAAGAATTLHMIPQPSSTAAIALDAGLAVVAYWCLNSFFTGFLSALRNHGSPVGAIRDQLRSQVELSLIAVSGGAIGFVASEHATPFLAFLAVPLMFMAMNPGQGKPRRATSSTAAAALTVTFIGIGASAIATQSPLNLALVMAAIPVAAKRVGWLPTAIVLLLGCCLGLALNADDKPIGVLVVWILVGVISGVASRLVPTVEHILRKRLMLDRWVYLGLVIPTRADIAVSTTSAAIGLFLLRTSSTVTSGVVAAGIVLICAVTLNRSSLTHDSPSSIESSNSNQTID